MRSLFFWPLRKLLTYSLESPALLRFGTRMASYYPPLFNWLLSFAQSRGIVMAEEHADIDPEEIQSVAELSPAAEVLFDRLKAAFKEHQGNNF